MGREKRGRRGVKVPVGRWKRERGEGRGEMEGGARRRGGKNGQRAGGGGGGCSILHLLQLKAYASHHDNELA